MTDSERNVRKCCGTPRGSGPHAPGCSQAANQPTLKQCLGEMSPADRIVLLDDFAGDLPDGAYFAMAEEMGIETEDFFEDEPS